MIILAIVPVFPDVQSILLRLMLREKQWEIINAADLTHVWEQVRRDLFLAAVKQGKWELVERWADHRLYHDQRRWAMEETLEQGQWRAHMLLSNYGLTPRDLRRARFQVAKNGDWDTVLDMLDNGTDVVEIREFVEGAKGGRFRRSDEDTVSNNRRRARDLLSLEQAIQGDTQQEWIAEYCKNPRTEYSCKRRSAMHKLIQTRPLDHTLSSKVLQSTMKYKAWNIIKHLARHELDASQRSELFPMMVKQQQWGICRELLERGVDITLCLSALQDLMNASQWLLVSRIMEYDVGDSVRRQVMQCALEKREGSVVWYCISNLQQNLTLEKRQTLFDQSFKRGMWQAVKPLIEFRCPGRCLYCKVVSTAPSPLPTQYSHQPSRRASLKSL
jgi:hypothetical protein